MSKYTTGEIARLCGVSVRTVQYYDDRGILIPSALSEGGRRLYSEDDLKRMRIVCFLRDAGFSINNISALFADEKPESILSVLLEQQEKSVRAELSECQKKLEILKNIQQEFKTCPSFSVESIGDIAYMMKQKKKLSNMRWMMALTGIPVTALQWIAIILGIVSGFWWLLAVWACVSVSWGIGVSVLYFKRVAYICPECHEVFKPRFKEAFWAYHTPKMRRLTCPSCERRGLCVEVYAEQENASAGKGGEKQ